MRSPFLLSTALMGLALSGCAVGPDYAPPQVQAGDGWLEAAAAPGEVDARWWESYGDPMLTGLVEQALAGAPDIRVAQARLAEARAMREAAQGGRMPQVTASGSIQETRISENGQIPLGRIPGFQPEFPLVDLGFDASWEIDVWGATERQVQGAAAREDAARWSLQDARLSLAAEVTRAYVEFRAAQHQLEIAEQRVSAAQELAELSALLADAGEADARTANDAAANLESQRGARDQAGAAMMGAAYRIAALVGQVPDDVVPQLRASNAPVPAPPALIASGVRSELLERRPDIRRAERQLAAATADIGVATADLYPRFSLVGGIGTQAQQAGDLTDSGSLRYNFGPSFHWPIFSFGRIRAQIRAADARADGAVAAYEKAVLSALAESESAANRYAASLTAAEAAQAALAREEQTFVLAELRYGQGEDSRLALEQAKLKLAGARAALVDAQSARAIAATSFHKALGGGWQGEE